jgi:hypothetical protein
VTVTKLPGDVSLGGSSRELSHSIQWTTYCENITPVSTRHSHLQLPTTGI